MFQKQKIMRRVLLALAPIFLFSIYLYGWRVLTLCAVVFTCGILTEYFFEKWRKKKVSEACLVTCALYVLSLPPATPLWIAAVGIIFGIFFGKEIFGGFGRNIFNPAICGRLFIYIAFPTVLSKAWMVPGQFGTAGMAGVDAVTAATPLSILRAGAEAVPDLLGRFIGETVHPLLNMFLGFRGGSIGESSTLLILIAALYLLATKTAQWRLMISSLAASIVLSTIFYLTGIAPHLAPHISLMSGSMLYIAVFMCTDPITAPNKPIAQICYGTLIGSVTIIIRAFSGFPEGTSFAILMGNVFSSFLDTLFPKKKTAKKKTAGIAARPQPTQGASS